MEGGRGKGEGGRRRRGSEGFLVSFFVKNKK